MVSAAQIGTGLTLVPLCPRANGLTSVLQENPFLPRSNTRPGGCSGRLTWKPRWLLYLPLYKPQRLRTLPKEQNLLSNLIIPSFGEFTVKHQALDLNWLGSAVMQLAGLIMNWIVWLLQRRGGLCWTKKEKEEEKSKISLSRNPNFSVC